MVVKKEGLPTSEDMERERDWYIKKTYVDSNNSKAISMPYSNTKIEVT